MILLKDWILQFKKPQNMWLAGMALNEKIAGLLLPDLRGSLDFNSGFISSNLSFCKWCQEYNNYIWSESEKAIL